MKNYYFTFGQSHCDNSGNELKDYYVRVEADSYDISRKIFISEFAEHYLPKPNGWAFQYEDKNFDASFYPKGELAHYVGTKLTENL